MARCVLLICCWDTCCCYSPYVAYFTHQVCVLWFIIHSPDGAAGGRQSATTGDHQQVTRHNELSDGEVGGGASKQDAVGGDTAREVERTERLWWSQTRTHVSHSILLFPVPFIFISVFFCQLPSRFLFHFYSNFNKKSYYWKYVVVYNEVFGSLCIIIIIIIIINVCCKSVGLCDRVMKSLEFSNMSTDSASVQSSSGESDKAKTLETLLLEKNRALQTENTQLKVTNNDLNSEFLTASFCSSCESISTSNSYQENMYPRHFVHDSTCTQDDLYPGRIVPVTKLYPCYVLR